MNYVTTNIRISEEDYLRLKSEAAKKRASLSAIIREKISDKDKQRPQAEVRKILQQTNRLGKELGKKLKGFDSIKALREMRYEDKW